jgi:hypothetical protein
MRTKWTDREISLAKSMLWQSSSIQEACNKLATFGIVVTKDALHTALHRHTGNAPSSYLGGGQQQVRVKASQPKTPVEVDHVAARRAQIRDRQARRLFDSQVDRLRELEERDAVLSALHSTPLPPIEIDGSHDGDERRECAAVALLSDVHYGEVVEPSRSTYGNKYNTTISAYRLHRFFTGVEWLIKCNRAWANINHLVLWFGGDLITGHIHDELVDTALNPIESILQLEPILIGGVRRMLELGLDVTLPCSYGNHGRTTVKKRIQTGAQHSYEWLSYQHMGSHLTRDGVKVLADPTPHQFVDVYGKTLHFSHGDDAKYNGGVGGITIPLNKATDAWHKVNPAYLSNYGHFHTLFDGGRWMVNGSLIGFNQFAMSIKATPEFPQQWFYIMDSKRGKSTRSPIWVSDPEAEALL